MRHFGRFFLRSLPFVLGIILTLMALAFLVAFTDRASFETLEDEEFLGFVLFAAIGFPLTLFGIDRLASNEDP